MSFSQFKNIEQVIEQYPLKMNSELFLPDVLLELPEWFMENLNFLLKRQISRKSEEFFRESFIFPFLQQAWKRHEQLELWCNLNLVYDDVLNGEPDYFVSVGWQGEVINKLVNTPLLAVVEAKKQDFDEGWGQYLAEMIACQKLNSDENITVYGIVSTGMVWEFAKLSKNTYTKHPLSYSISDPQKVFGNLDYVFAECEKQMTSNHNGI
jgi:hypothetical protein